jgi:hypothetical protein
MICISAGFDSALGDPLGEVGVTPVGYAYMTQGLRKICPKIAVALEGGYNLEALACSSMAVIKTLLTRPSDQEGFEKLLQHLGKDFGYSDEGKEPLTEVSLLAASLDPTKVRETFKRTALRIAKLLSD